MTQSRDDGLMMYVPRMDVFLNRWFTTYDEARASRESEGGYLFPYKDHFFVAEAGAIEELGLDPDDPDWACIGWDWVQPMDREACERAAPAEPAPTITTSHSAIKCRPVADKEPNGTAFGAPPTQGSGHRGKRGCGRWCGASF